MYMFKCVGWNAAEFRRLAKASRCWIARVVDRAETCVHSFLGNHTDFVEAVAPTYFAILVDPTKSIDGCFGLKTDKGVNTNLQLTVSE